MFKILSTLLSLLSIVLSIKFVITCDNFKSPLAICYYVSFVISFVLIMLVRTGGKEKKGNYLVLERGTDGELKVSQKVFIDLAENVLKEKKEIKNYKIKIKNSEERIEYRIYCEPDLSGPFSFVEFSNRISEEIKEIVKAYTTFEVEKIHFNFLATEE